MHIEDLWLEEKDFKVTTNVQTMTQLLQIDQNEGLIHEEVLHEE